MLQIETSKSGKPTLKLNSLYLHSKYDPVREGKQIAESIDINKKTCLVVFGMGLGYHILPFLKQRILKIIIIEKYPELVKIAKDIKILNIKENINIFTGNIEGLNSFLHKIISEYESSSIVTLTHNPSYKIDRLYYDEAKDIFAGVQKIKLQSYITSLAFSKRWHENILKNIKYLPKLHTLLKQYRDFPVFIIASGPSLNHNIELLYKIQKKGIIIALSSTYRILKQNNIKVDFLISIDGGIANRIHLIDNEMNNEDNLCFISTLSVTPYFFRNWNGKVLLINHGLPSEDNIISSFFPNIAMQGTVSITAFNIAKTISKGDIYLIGFDFALTDGNYHHKGNSMEDIFLYSHDKIETLETKLYKLIDRFQISELKLADNSYVKTNASMKSYLIHLEKEIALSPNSVFNVNSTGAIIKGTKGISFEEILKLKSRDINSHSLIERITKENYAHSKKKINTLISCYIKTKGLLEGEKDEIDKEELLCFINSLNKDFKDLFNFSQMRLLKNLKDKIDPEVIEDLIYSIERSMGFLTK